MSEDGNTTKRPWSHCELCVCVCVFEKERVCISLFFSHFFSIECGLLAVQCVLLPKQRTKHPFVGQVSLSPGHKRRSTCSSSIDHGRRAEQLETAHWFSSSFMILSINIEPISSTNYVNASSNMNFTEAADSYLGC